MGDGRLMGTAPQGILPRLLQILHSPAASCPRTKCSANSAAMSRALRPIPLLQPCPDLLVHTGASAHRQAVIHAPPDTGHAQSRSGPSRVPSGQVAVPWACRNCPWRASVAHCVSTSSGRAPTPAATAAAANSTPATLAAATTACSAGGRRSNCCSISCRSVSGTPTVVASRGAVSSQPSGHAAPGRAAANRRPS